MESPITFNIKIIEDSFEKAKPDLCMFLSLDTKEPHRGNCNKVADRLSRFRFAAPYGAVYFEDSKILYICIESMKGCEIEVRISSFATELAKRQAEKSHPSSLLEEEPQGRKKQYNMKALEEAYDEECA